MPQNAVDGAKFPWGAKSLPVWNTGLPTTRREDRKAQLGWFILVKTKGEPEQNPRVLAHPHLPYSLPAFHL